MARRLISSGSAFESAIGYSRAVVSGDWVFVSGCTGYIYLSVCLQHVSTYATSLLLPFPLSHIPCLPTYLSSSPSPRTTNATKLNRTKIYMKKKLATTTQPTRSPPASLTKPSSACATLRQHSPKLTPLSTTSSASATYYRTAATSPSSGPCCAAGSRPRGPLLL